MRLDFSRPDAAEYLAVLNALLIFHTAVAEFSREAVTRELGPKVALLGRTQALRTDIRLMADRLPTAVDQACVFQGRPAFGTRLRGGREERIGAAYVAAGSVLGGRVIAANLAASGCGDFPRSFFASDGLDLGRHWLTSRPHWTSSVNPGLTPPGSLRARCLLTHSSATF